jgi:hypothetical protein
VQPNLFKKFLELSIYPVNMEEAAMMLAGQREFSVTKQHQPSDQLVYGRTSTLLPP